MAKEHSFYTKKEKSGDLVEQKGNNIKCKRTEGEEKGGRRGSRAIPCGSVGVLRKEAAILHLMIPGDYNGTGDSLIVVSVFGWS